MKAQGWQETVVPKMLEAEPEGLDGISLLSVAPHPAPVDFFPYWLACHC